MLHKTTATQYRLNPDYWKLKYFRAQSKLQSAHQNAYIAGLATAILFYLTIKAGR